MRNTAIQLHIYKKRNKRGQLYCVRPNKVANGISKHYGSSTNMSDNMMTLHVKGTFDVLAKSRFDFIWITMMHPLDPSYTKRVRILKRNKKKFIERIPVTERGIDTYKIK